VTKHRPEPEPQPEPEPEATPPAPEEPNLSLEDTIAQKMRGVPVKARTSVGGYNPYDAEPAAKGKGKGKGETQKSKTTDLRKLSEWIRLQRQVAELNQEKPKDKT
jgi:hypothetical protein